MYVCMYVCMYVYIYICMYVCMYVYVKSLLVRGDQAHQREDDREEREAPHLDLILFIL